MNIEVKIQYVKACSSVTAQRSFTGLEWSDGENIRLSITLSKVPRMQYSALRAQIRKKNCSGSNSETGQDNFTRFKYVVAECSFSVQTENGSNNLKKIAVFPPV